MTSDEPSTSKRHLRHKSRPTRPSRRSTLKRRGSKRGLANEAELTTLARTIEARKKVIGERQKEIYNSLARYGKALDKVSRWYSSSKWKTLTAHRGSRRRCRLMSLSLHQKIRRALWNTSSPRISSRQGAFLRQRLSSFGTLTARERHYGLTRFVFKQGIRRRTARRATVAICRFISNTARSAKRTRKASLGVCFSVRNISVFFHPTFQSNPRPSSMPMITYNHSSLRTQQKSSV